MSARDSHFTFRIFISSISLFNLIDIQLCSEHSFANQIATSNHFGHASPHNKCNVLHILYHRPNEAFHRWLIHSVSSFIYSSFTHSPIHSFILWSLIVHTSYSVSQFYICISTFWVRKFARLIPVIKIWERIVIVVGYRQTVSNAPRCDDFQTNITKVTNYKQKCHFILLHPFMQKEVHTYTDKHTNVDLFIIIFNY